MRCSIAGPSEGVVVFGLMSAEDLEGQQGSVVTIVAVQRVVQLWV